MKGWKTIGFNIISGIVLIIQGQGVEMGLDPETIAFIIVIANFLLRFFTSTPVGKSS